MLGLEIGLGLTLELGLHLEFILALRLVLEPMFGSCAELCFVMGLRLWIGLGLGLCNGYG